MIHETDLPDEMMAQAAQDFFASEWASAREEAGFRFRPGTRINAECSSQDGEKLIELVRPYLARLSVAWGMGVGEVFRLMEIPERRWSDALYYVLMGCRGHGIGLADRFGENIQIAEDKLCKGIDPSPFDAEFNEFSDLAFEVVEAEALKPDDGPDSDAPLRSGDRVRVEARMPTGDSLTGSGGVVRWLPAGGDLSFGGGVIVTMNDEETVEPWSYRGRTVLVDEAEAGLWPDAGTSESLPR